MFKKSSAAILLALFASIFMIACGGDDGGGSSDDPGANREDAMIAFSECMRENGIDMPDPQPGGGMMIDAESGIDPESTEFKAAQEACGEILEDARPEGMEEMTEIPQEMLDYAACMREQGIDFPDPKLEDGRLTMRAGGPGMDGSRDEMEAADEECHDLLPEDGPMGAGPGVAAPSGE